MFNNVPVTSNYRDTIALHERRTERFMRRFSKKY